MKKYGDIIRLPHHVSSVHPHMPVSDRAAQFAPFAALTGYGDVIKETARQTDARPELSEDEKEALDYKIQLACGLPGDKPEITITCFVPDEKKSGGAYHIASGRIIRSMDMNINLFWIYLIHLYFSLTALNGFRKMIFPYLIPIRSTVLAMLSLLSYSPPQKTASRCSQHHREASKSRQSILFQPVSLSQCPV